jgi:hypothetical protein
MTNGKYQIVENPPVSFRMYWPEALLLLASVATPFIALAIWHNGNMFGRSGSVMTFLALLAEFVSLNRMNKKHILNACRVNANEIPWGFSHASKVVGYLSLLCALVGTLIWGYGDLWL